MEPTEQTEYQSQPKPIEISSDHFSFANVEAWLNIIRSYQDKHPSHKVHILYEGEEIRNRMTLFKLERPVNRQGFQCYVSALDRNLEDVPKLYRLLHEGAGPNHGNFRVKEVHRILDLF